MSDVIDAAVTRLNKRLQGFDGTAKFVISGEGSILIDESGAREGDADADVTMTAETDVFRAILDGEMDPTTAFMSGKLGVEGSMGLAVKLAAALS